MKKLNFSHLRSFIAIASLFLIGCLASCSNTDDNASTTTTIESVNTALNTPTDGSPVQIDVPTETGLPNNTYFIKGTGFSTLQKVYFNGVESYFNPTLVTDTVIVITIDQDTPYENVSSELKVVTKNGTAVYHFVIAPPSPVLTRGFSPVNAADGSTMTIYGNFFLDPIVTFGTIPATVISSTLTEIKVKVPVGADKKFVSVKTISGTATSTYAVGTAIFDEVGFYGLDFPSWNNHTYESDANADQGVVYIKKKMDAWGNIQGNWGWYDKIADYSGIRISIKADNPGTLKLVFNGNWSERNLLDVTTGWTTFVIPWSQLGDADHVQNISFQNFTKNASGDGLSNTFYIDNIGFTLK